MNFIIVDSATGAEHLVKLTESGPEQNVQQEFHVEKTVLPETGTDAPSSTTVQVTQGTVEKPNVCQVCGKGFARIAFLNVHMRVHTGEKPYSCNICQATFTGQTALQRHILRHNGIKAYKCQYCDKSYVLKNQCRDHEKLHTATVEEIKKNKCDICDRAYRYPFQLKVHRRVHTGEKPIACNICDKHFTSGKVLYEHVRRVHTKDKPYQCSDCEKPFSDFADFKRHLLTHSDEKPFTCDNCGISFKRKFALKRHTKSKICLSEKSNMDKSFCCKVCDRRFALELSLNMHSEIAHEGYDETENHVEAEMKNSNEDKTEN